MASFNKLPGFVENLANKVHNLGSDQIMLALSNTAPGSESTPPNGATSACVLANVTQVAYTNLSTRVITITSSTQSGGTYSLVGNNLVLTSSGGSTGPFRYVYIFNNTATNKNLIGYWDYGSSITLADGETLTVTFGSNILTVA